MGVGVPRGRKKKPLAPQFVTEDAGEGMWCSDEDLKGGGLVPNHWLAVTFTAPLGDPRAEEGKRGFSMSWSEEIRRDICLCQIIFMKKKT